MRVKLLVPGAIILLLFQGCVTVTDSKVLVITPRAGESKIVVSSKATAKCYDFVVLWCRLYLEMEQVR